ncbi:MAG TPA: MBL fold metallo-hydrolase [Gammaproteobacteria bacterium]|nr:MBL fold metallo-hydrolase [Gammaproteobacteria bacterium]
MIKKLSLVLLLLCWGSVGVAEAEKAIVAEIPPATVSMPLKKLSEHVYYVQGAAGVATDNEGFISNAAAIITSKGIVMVDALGTPSLAKKFLDQLRKVTDKPVIMAIATHYHADHIYGLQVFKAEGAEVIAPAGYQDYLDLPVSSERLEERRVSLAPWVNEDTHIVLPDRVIDKNTTLKIGDIELDLVYLGTAHSDGDLSVLVKNDDVLISGDIIFEGRVPFTGSADTAHWLEVLEKLDNTGLKALLPGHGAAAKDPAKAVKMTLSYLKTVREAMQNGVDEMLTFDEAYENADWSEFENLPAFDAAHRRNAYGVFLSLEAESLK